MFSHNSHTALTMTCSRQFKKMIINMKTQNEKIIIENTLEKHCIIKFSPQDEFPGRELLSES